MVLPRFLAALTGCAWIALSTASFAGNVAKLENFSRPTRCAEEDNVNIVLSAPTPREVVQSFTIEAFHPSYSYQQDFTAPNFTHCDINASEDFPFANPVMTKVFDDGETSILAIRQEGWWRPSGMTVSAPGSQSGEQQLVDAHYIAVHRKASEGHYPQVMVLYADGNLRVKPQPPGGVADTVFGSSVLIGAAAPTGRPVADIDSLTFRPESSSFDVAYRSGDTAQITLEAVNQQTSRLRVDTQFAGAVPFATLRSMYVEDGNADVDRLRWLGLENGTQQAPAMELEETLGRRFDFLRQHLSVHNTSAPDIRIGDFHFQTVPEPASCTPFSIVLLVLVRRWRRR